MKSIHWVAVAIGYLIGSFFGLSTVLGLFGNMGSKKAAPAA